MIQPLWDGLPISMPRELPDHACSSACTNDRSAVIRSSTPHMVATGGGGMGLFTSSNPEDRRVVPDDAGDRKVFKVVYVVLESQYQSSLTAACKRINAGQVCFPHCPGTNPQVSTK